MTDADPEQSHVNPADIDGLDDLIDRMAAAETVEDWSFILSDHLSYGNKKLADTIAIFNMGTATDCLNRGTKHCQVGESECYAYRSENTYPGVVDYRRRQEYLWDSLDPDTFAEAFLEVVRRKRNPVDTLRLNESGDFRTQGDVIRAERVAERLAEHDIQTYTYTASDFLDWSPTNHLTVNASNERVEDADQRYIVVASDEDIPESGFKCPGECGPCLACMHGGGTGDIYELHYYDG